MKALLITMDFSAKILDGGESIDKRNYEFLNRICNKLDVFVIANKKEKKGYYQKIKTLINIILFNDLYGAVPNVQNKIIKQIKNNKYDFCFISSSIAGNLVKNIKFKFNALRIIVFCHNVEVNFYKSLAENSPKYKYLLAWSATKNELLTMKYADEIIALNSRDAKGIEKIYKRRVDFILPTTFNDTYNRNNNVSTVNIKDNTKILLFIGSNFFANYQGIKWFIENVLSELNNINLYIVGKGTEAWKIDFKEISNLKIMGSVESLEEYYEMASAVILPIFLGSGMKTKTAEALMHGKYIFGTTEAFQGYDLDISKVGALCNTKEEFINAINEKLSKINNPYNDFSRKEFLLKYSTDVWIKKFKSFLLENKTAYGG